MADDVFSPTVDAAANAAVAHNQKRQAICIKLYNLKNKHKVNNGIY